MYPKISRVSISGKTTLRSDPASRGTDGLMVGDAHRFSDLVDIRHGQGRRQVVGTLMKTVDTHGRRLRCPIDKRYVDILTGSM